MKVQKSITLDIEVFKKLSEISNASGLIQRLLIEHFKDNRTEEQIIEDVKKEIELKKKNKIDKEKKDKETAKLRNVILKEMKKDEKVQEM